ncbi:MKRN2 opposite strand protein isoform X2 [Camponotus floridanus]|uniref:MKRN2 opposite strand protein isoform X2 n=1 Tax=Camponotus floridanus TaxID=104421 RepID=UPI00059D1CBD|nr:MKRN2 opposite strand protein isoform X2 [Camponotus floridanus]
MRIPTTCPVCSSRIQDFIVDPFRVPYPFANAAHNPTSIAIRPSRGSFLDDYDVTSDDLHVGIIDSDGGIVEFDKDGLIANDVDRWIGCVAFHVVPVAWTAQWDETLSSMSRDDRWKSVNYDEINMNCFDFVLEFLNNLGYANLKFASKEDLCERLILSKIQNAIKYISLYRALKHQEYLLSDHLSYS